ncbi:DUF7527 domain-containing protein [Natronolimnobius baerhuensis]|uniref:Transcriptional regulator n=1 Tax=Natronolimnobius baerhuensis TaxID=253108 RepID=A0A202E963_9EURY|nr:hypothetical protein [Natronolimnobius baerhuensis]OVE84782.1 transcriptional regulator [Natronolimnobius baerhuensis]
MESRTQERVEQWDSRPFSGGYDGLSDLADSGFSGAVTAASTWLFMLNGRIVGVVDGAIDDFEAASGTTYQAPHPSLPLLYAMDEQGGETRAQYYTNETSLAEVDQTLQDGSFTGYIELSENVLSGDYYAVYYGGRRMAAAYIGNAERLVTGDEAFEKANDEVGIYEVIDVEITVTDVPGSDPDTATEPDSEPSPTGTDRDATSSVAGLETDPEPEPSVDPTESAVDPIDVSSGDAVSVETDATGLEDLTATGEESADGASNDADDAAGITTAYDETATTESASGITDVDVDVETGSDAGNAGADVPGDETGKDATQASESSAAEADSEAQSGSGPDPADVEAAAEQLEQNDISWTDDKSGDDDSVETAAEPATSESAEPSTDVGDVDEPDADSSTVASSQSAADAADATGAAVTTDAADTDDDADDDTAEGDEDDSQLEERFEEEEQWRETRQIPSIDPDNSVTTESTAKTRARNRRARRADSNSSQSASQSDSSPSADAAGSSRQSSQTDTAESHQTDSTPSRTRTETTSNTGQRSRSTDSDRTTTSEATDTAASQTPTAERNTRLERLTDRIERLEEQREALESKNKELVSERNRLRTQNQELSDTVNRLEARIDDLESSAASGDDAVSAATALSPAQALAGTNLFVRYASKSQPTLEMAHDGEADRDEVATNLRLEQHTEFEADSVAVDGTPYEEFLASTMAYQFVDWLTEMALYEIRDTGNAGGLGDLYDAIPRIDRAELNATISLADDETDDVPDELTFDVVAFDKMGNPLVLATLNDSREPVTEDTLVELEEAASAVKANYPDLAASMAITSSYFEPGALEVTEQATSSGFLSRGSKLSYVNLSRKSGYHLCLVESRSEGFHMNVPEL